jgi:hypothetical protein
MQTPEVLPSQNVDQKSTDNRLKFKMSVQIEVMKKLGFFDTPQYKNAPTPEDKMYAENDIFMNWINSGYTNLFRDCFEELFPPGSEKTVDELPQAVTAIMAEMRLRERH